MSAVCHEIAGEFDAQLCQRCIRCGYPVVDYSAALGGQVAGVAADVGETLQLRPMPAGSVVVLHSGPVMGTWTGNTYLGAGGRELVAPPCEWNVAREPREPWYVRLRRFLTEHRS